MGKRKANTELKRKSEKEGSKRKKTQTPKRLLTKGNLQGEGLNRSVSESRAHEGRVLGGKTEEDSHWLQVVSLR